MTAKKPAPAAEQFAYGVLLLSAYGIGLSVSLVMQGLLRNCYMVQNSVLPPAIVRNRAAKVMGQHLIIWLTIAIVESVLLIALLEDGTDARAVSIMAATLTTTLIYGLDDRVFARVERGIGQPPAPEATWRPARQ